MLGTFPSIKEAALAAGVSSGSIVDACKGRSHTSAGYIWKYY